MSGARADTGAVTLVVVAGAVEPALLREFFAHYRRLGVERFLVGFHFDEDAADAEVAAQVAECRRLEVFPEIVTRGTWTSATNAPIRDELRRRAGPGWHVIADIDEFQHHPDSVRETILRAVEHGTRHAEGLLFDRVAATGSLEGWQPQTGLDASYPLGAFFTHLVLDGDPRKVMVVHASVEVASGNHRVLTEPRRSPMPPLPVHHFKWRGGTTAYLRGRARRFEGSQDPEERSMRREALRLLAHLERQGGAIGVDRPELGFRPTSTQKLPPAWSVDAKRVSRYWWETRWIGVRHWWEAAEREGTPLSSP